MKIHYLQHVEFEGPGCLYDWFRKPGNSVTATRLFEDTRLPFIDICDVLLVMGGPMGVYDDNEFPWLKKEKAFIEKALRNGKKVIGICLGAQLLADVLGAKVYKNPNKEIGWFPVNFTKAALNLTHFKFFNNTETVFHWHGDTFEIPAGALEIGHSEACRNQGFIYKDQALALQFHMEMKKENIAALMENCKNDLDDAPFVQKPEKLADEQFMKKNNDLIISLLSSFCNG